MVIGDLPSVTSAPTVPVIHLLGKVKGRNKQRGQLHHHRVMVGSLFLASFYRRESGNCKEYLMLLTVHAPFQVFL